MTNTQDRSHATAAMQKVRENYYAQREEILTEIARANFCVNNKNRGDIFRSDRPLDEETVKLIQRHYKDAVQAGLSDQQIAGYLDVPFENLDAWLTRSGLRTRISKTKGKKLGRRAEIIRDDTFFEELAYVRSRAEYFARVWERSHNIDYEEFDWLLERIANKLARKAGEYGGRYAYTTISIKLGILRCLRPKEQSIDVFTREPFVKTGWS